MSEQRKCQRILKSGKICGKDPSPNWFYCPECLRIISYRDDRVDDNYVYGDSWTTDQLIREFKPPRSTEELEQEIKILELESLDY